MKNKHIFNFDDINDSGFMPDFCDVRVVFMLVLLIEIIAIVLAMASFRTMGQFWNQLAFYSLLMQWIGLLNAAVLCNARHWLNKQPLRTTIFSSFVIMMLISGIVSLFVTKIDVLIEVDSHDIFDDTFILRISVISAVIYGVLLRYLYNLQQWKKLLHANSQAEIQALKARIRPHFLFNSMNTIASLISFKPDVAEKAVEDLSDLFRASLTESNSNTLSDEINLVRSYLDIETLRLGDRLQIVLEIDEKANDIEIPALILQPLVENAIYHGIEPLTDGGKIKISAHLENQQLLLSVQNPITKSSKQSQNKGNKMAQDNIRQRLLLVYNGNAKFLIDETDTDYIVTLSIPLGIKENQHESVNR